MPYRNNAQPLSSAPPAPLGKRFASTWRYTYRSATRRLSSSLTRRIILLNMAGLVAMLLGFLWLIQTRDSVIDARMQSLSTQARIISAAIAASASVDTDGIRIDPDKLLSLQTGETGDIFLDTGRDVVFSLNPERIAPVLRQLVTPTRTRARIYDSEASLLLDTQNFYSPGDITRRNLSPPEDKATIFTRSWNSFKQKFGKTLFLKDDGNNGRFTEIKTALGGTESSIVRVNTEGQTVVFVSVPITRFKTVPGALLLSTQEGDVDDVIAAERFSIFLVFLLAASVMTILSFLLAGTIAEPVRRLADAADRVRRGTQSRHEIPDFTERTDEIGHLSGALREMTKALYNRIEAIESFAADVTHELKNPLTSLRSAVETLPLTKSDDSKKRLLDVIHHDVRRLDRLISDISDASRLDGDLQRQDMGIVAIEDLLHTLVKTAQDTCRKDIIIEFDIAQQSSKNSDLYLIQGFDRRLAQVFTNLIDNAISFSPPSSLIKVGLRRIGQIVEITIEDEGPGIPDHALKRVFERFYTDRPEHGFGQNSGLGLSISQQIIEAHRGQIWAENSEKGARFVIHLQALNPW